MVWDVINTRYPFNRVTANNVATKCLRATFSEIVVVDVVDGMYFATI